jgi:DNA replication protein DnaC
MALVDSEFQYQAARCDTHGEYQQRVVNCMGTLFLSKCPECTRAIDADEAERKASAASIERRLDIRTRLGSAMIPPRFAGKSFDSYQAVSEGQKGALSTCMAYAKEFDAHEKVGRCLLLIGKPGTGKTHLAASIAAWLIENTGRTVVYRTVAGILQYVKGSFDSNATYTEAQAFKALQSADLLIIDEVGATKPTEFEQATLFQVINDRYEQCRPTCIISNLDAKEIAPVLGERSVDRLREGGGIPVIFDWSSERAKAFLKGGSN